MNHQAINAPLSKEMNPIYFDLLRGTLDPLNPLSKLRANPLVWSKIFHWVEWYKSHISPTENAYKVMPNYGRFWHPDDIVAFPPPTGIQINMMPIRLFHPDTFPENIRAYTRMILRCACHSSQCMMTRTSENNQVVYLTIHESRVPVGESQRRQGLHIERPGICAMGGHTLSPDPDPDTNDRSLYRHICWGSGYYSMDNIPIDGIFMASTVSNSCQIWPCQITNPHEVSDAHGGIEPMRTELGELFKIPKNQLVWFTDTTPHEALPVESETGETHVYRQFFRLVMGKISVWYSKHNTPNPLGVLPDAPISDVDKFAR